MEREWSLKGATLRSHDVKSLKETLQVNVISYLVISTSDRMLLLLIWLFCYLGKHTTDSIGCGKRRTTRKNTKKIILKY